MSESGFRMNLSKHTLEGYIYHVSIKFLYRVALRAELSSMKFHLGSKLDQSGISPPTSHNEFLHDGLPVKYLCINAFDQSLISHCLLIDDCFRMAFLGFFHNSYVLMKDS